MQTTPAIFYARRTCIATSAYDASLLDSLRLNELDNQTKGQRRLVGRGSS